MSEASDPARARLSCEISQCETHRSPAIQANSGHFTRPRVQYCGEIPQPSPTVDGRKTLRVRRRTLHQVKLTLVWFTGSLIVGVLSIPLTALYGAVWLIPCGPILVMAIALWPLLARHIPVIERSLPMSLTIAAISLVAALVGMESVFGNGTGTDPLVTLIPFFECLAVLLLPRLFWPSIQPGAFSSGAF
jgi:hypothetical protein